MKVCNECIAKKYKEIQEFCAIEYKKTDREVLPRCFFLEERYVLKFMKSGGYSNIYYAFDMKRKEQVLVKELYLEELYIGRNRENFLIPNEEKRERLENKLTLFIKEAKKMNHLRRISSIPKMYDFIIKNENAFIVMEYINGTNIFNLVADSSHDILKLFEPLVKDLIVMHNNNIIHRDISFQNLIWADKRVRLVDLGIAKRICYDNLGLDDNDLIFTERIETMRVSYEKPVEHKNHLYQDSRTDIYSLAKIILDIYRLKEITVPRKVQSVLENALSDNMAERCDSKKFYELIYGRNVRIKRDLTSIVLLCFIAVISYYTANGILNGKVQIANERNDDKNLSEDFMKERIEKESGCSLEKDYIRYIDFDGDGLNEMFALVPVEKDVTLREEWIVYGEIWFCDDENVSKVDVLGADDIAEGGIYTIELIQFGKEYQFEVNKYYDYVASAKGQSYIYAYIDGRPQKLHEIGREGPLIVNGVDGEETYLMDSDYKFSTQGLGRTFDKIYTYYKDGKYMIYKSELMDISDLYNYDNYEELVMECIEDIYDKSAFDTVGKPKEVIEYTEEILGKSVKIYECVNSGSMKYISLVNCYLNESGRIYLNLTSWDQNEALLSSHIWNKTNPYYPDPVEEIGANSGEGQNYYITFKIKKNNLEIESINEGYWEKRYADQDFLE